MYPADITARFIAETRKTLETMRGKIVHCLNQLLDEDINSRAFEGANSIANLVIHLCGNVSQWIITPVGGDIIPRNRPGEFATDLWAWRDELIAKLNATMARADQVIAAVTPETIIAPRKVQGYDETVMGAIFHATTHFEGHTHQIVYITRARLGNRYVFKWEPRTPEQMSAQKAN